MKSILVAVDFSDATDRVVGEAVRMAKLMEASLTLVHVAPAEPEFVGFETGPAVVRDAVAHQLRAEHRQLHEVEQRAAGQGVNTTALLIQGYAAEKILAEAARLSAQLIVMGSHGRGLLRHLVVGSVTDGVLRKAACPVLVVPVPKA